MAVLARLAPAFGCALIATFALVAVPMRADTTIHVATRMDPPRWALLERQLLAANVPAAREFFAKYFSEDGRIQCYVRWGANDGPDDAFEDFNRWPELHALGADDAVLQMYSRAHESLLKQYTEARTLVGRRLRLGLQPGQSRHQTARGSQPHRLGLARLRQRAAADR